MEGSVLQELIASYNNRIHDTRMAVSDDHFMKIMEELTERPLVLGKHRALRTRQKSNPDTSPTKLLLPPPPPPPPQPPPLLEVKKSQSSPQKRYNRRAQLTSWLLNDVKSQLL